MFASFQILGSEVLTLWADTCTAMVTMADRTHARIGDMIV